MSALEDLRPNASVRGILPDSLVTVVSVQWFGSDALELTYKTPSGKVANELLYRHDESRLELAEQGRPWSFADEVHLRVLAPGRYYKRFDLDWLVQVLNHGLAATLRPDLDQSLAMDFDFQAFPGGFPPTISEQEILGALSRRRAAYG